MNCEHRCGCVPRADAHGGRFQVGEKFGEQLIFVGSHPGAAGTPVAADRILVYLTVTNDGPRAIRVFWDGPPPTYKMPTSPAVPPPAPTNQFAVVLAGNSMSLAVSRAVKVVYAPDVDPAIIGDNARGCFVTSWCCPTNWAQASMSPPVVGSKEPVPAPKPAG